MRKILPYLLFVSITALFGFAYYTYTLFEVPGLESDSNYNKYASHNLEEIISSDSLSSREKLEELLKIDFDSKLLENRRKFLISKYADELDEDAIAFIYSYQVDISYLPNYSKKILIDHASYIGYEAVIVEEVKKLLKENNKNPEFHYILAKSFARQNLKTLAHKSFTYIQNNFPESDYAFGADYYLANLESEIDKKKTRFTRYLQNNPGGNLAPLILGQISGKDEYKFLSNEIAMVYFNLEDYQNAIKYFDTSLESFVPEYYGAYAKTLAKNKEYMQSKNFLVEKLEEVNDAKLASRLLNALLTLGNSHRDLIVLKALKFKTKVVQDEILWHIAERTKSKYDYQSVYENYPESNYAAESMSRVFWLEYKRKAFHLAEKLFETHWDKYTETRSHSFVAFWMAKLYLERGEADKARAVLNNLISAHPLNYYSYRAKTILKELKTKKNIDWYQLPAKSQINYVSSWNRPELFSVSEIDNLYGEEIKELFLTKSYDYIIDNVDDHNSFDKRFLTYVNSLAENNLKSIRLAHTIVQDSFDFNNQEEHELYQYAYPLLYSGLIASNIDVNSKLDPFIATL